MGSEKHPCCVVFGSIEAMKLKCENVPRGTTCTKCQSGRDFTCSKLQLSCGLIETTGQWIIVTYHTNHCMNLHSYVLDWSLLCNATILYLSDLFFGRLLLYIQIVIFS